MSIAYSNLFSELEGIADHAMRILAEAGEVNAQTSPARIGEAVRRLKEQAPLRVAFVGEFNAGKSSLISALTGAEVSIDADVCTSSIEEFPWRGLTVVDTPGIQAQKKGTDHDHLARQATSGADLILFVITNELFNPRLATHLRFVLDEDGLGLANKTALIVNKMDRESNPDAVILGEVQQVLGSHQGIPVFFASSRKLLQAQDAPEALRQRLVVQSRMEVLVEGIDRFVDDSGALGRLLTPLVVVEEVLETLVAGLVTTDEDRNHIEIIRRQKVVLQGLQGSLREVRKTWKSKAYSTVSGHSDRAVRQVGATSTGEDLERLFESTMASAIADIEAIHDGAEDAINEALEDARERIEEIGASPLAKVVGQEDNARSERAKVGFEEVRVVSKAYGGRLGKAALDPLKKGLDEASKNAKGLGKIVYKIGKAMGKKFRPHGASNVGKSLAGAASKAVKVLPFLAVALDFYVQYSEEKAKDQQARHLANMRIALGNAFAEQARLESECLESAINAVSQGVLADSLASLDQQASDIAARHQHLADRAKDVSDLKRRCTLLRSRIVAGSSSDLSASVHEIGA